MFGNFIEQVVARTSNFHDNFRRNFERNAANYQYEVIVAENGRKVAIERAEYERRQREAKEKFDREHSAAEKEGAKQYVDIIQKVLNYVSDNVNGIDAINQLLDYIKQTHERQPFQTPDGGTATSVKPASVSFATFLNYHPEHIAAEHGAIDVLKHLKLNGASLNTENEKGDTPLHKAALKGHENVVFYLVEEQELSLFKRNHAGITPMDYLKVGEHLEILELFSGIIEITDEAQEAIYSCMNLQAALDMLQIKLDAIQNENTVVSRHQKEFLNENANVLRSFLKQTIETFKCDQRDYIKGQISNLDACFQNRIQNRDHAQFIQNPSIQGHYFVLLKQEYDRLEKDYFQKAQTLLESRVPMRNQSSAEYITLIQKERSIVEQGGPDYPNLEEDLKKIYIRLLEQTEKKLVGDNQLDQANLQKNSMEQLMATCLAQNAIAQQESEQAKIDQIATLVTRSRNEDVKLQTAQAVFDASIKQVQDLDDKDFFEKAEIAAQACAQRDLKLIDEVFKIISSNVDAVVNLPDGARMVRVASKNISIPALQKFRLAHVAAAHDDVAVLKHLKDKGLMLNKTDLAGNTPMHDAALEGKKNAMDYLLTEGLSLLQKNKAGMSPMMILQAKAHHQLVEQFSRITQAAQQDNKRLSEQADLQKRLQTIETILPSLTGTVIDQHRKEYLLTDQKLSERSLQLATGLFSKDQKERGNDFSFDVNTLIQKRIQDNTSDYYINDPLARGHYLVLVQSQMLDSQFRVQQAQEDARHALTNQGQTFFTRHVDDNKNDSNAMNTEASKVRTKVRPH